MKITTIYFKDKLSEEEYMSLCRFFTQFVSTTSTTMQRVPRIDRHSTSLLMAVNEYEIDEIIAKAKERLERPRSGKLRRIVLRKLLNILKEGD